MLKIKDRFLLGVISGLAGNAANLPQAKVGRKDPEGNLSNMGCHILYGLVIVFVATKLGHPSLFDAEPANDYLQPTEPTPEQLRNR